MFTVVLDQCCSRRVHVSCSVRSHRALCIEKCKALVIQRGDKDIELALHTSEGDLYGLLFSHGRMSSKFHGPSWTGLVNDYSLDYRDIMTIRLAHYRTMIVLKDLSESERELVDSSIYSRCVSVISDMVVRSLKEFMSVTLDCYVDDIYVSIPCSYFIGLGGRMVFKKEGFSDFLRASSIEVNNLVFITFKEHDEKLDVIFSLLSQ
ncbi:Receptor-like protein kinase HERK 1 [Hordeum vulgare]|nr:Receptor-like protein kinase HERK 1 [Hordeum vulgare]